MSAAAQNHPDSTTASGGHPAVWRDPARDPESRVEALLGAMTLEEKIAQLSAVWLDADSEGGEVAPFQDELESDDEEFDWDRHIAAGLGQLTRPFGTAPVAPRDGARRLRDLQEQVVAANRFALPALVHEECLTGWTAWQATIYPTPLAWGATFEPSLVERMAARIGADMRAFGVHLGLAPVLDVARDIRWGRTEETIGEDPYLVGTLASAYVRGLQGEGVHATLKHFVGYSASRGGRNFGPVSLGPRERAELLLPFEMAVREARARAVMASYIAVDGVPSHADGELLTTLLRDRWGFDGVVVSDYGGVGFLESQQRVAADSEEAAAAALAAGMDVELPMVRCYGTPLLDAVRAGRLTTGQLDTAVRRVLRQKCALGLLDPDFDPAPPALNEAQKPDLDAPESRALAREIAEKAVVLLANPGGGLPLPPTGSIAVVGPLADDPAAMLGCYTFPRHVGRHHPEVGMGVDIPTLLASLRAELPDAEISHAPGCTVAGAADDEDAIAAAARLAAAADHCIVVLGDHAGLFGLGTSGEGTDAASLRLPGRQDELLRAVTATATPTTAVVLSGRPYALGEHVEALSGLVQGFFPGEEGGSAVAGVLSGRVNPSGRLPVSVPRTADIQPAGHMEPLLGRHTTASTVDPTPLFPFGHGLSYTRFAWQDVAVDGGLPGPDGSGPRPDARFDTAGEEPVRVSLTVHNTGTRAGADVVQLYLHDPVAQVTQPVGRLIGYARVELAAGERRRVEFEVPPELLAIVGRDGGRVIEPGTIELQLSASSAEPRHTVHGEVVGAPRRLGEERRLTTTVRVHEAR